MRAEHLTAAEIQAYAARQLTAEAALQISDHLVECAECRALLRQAEQFRVPAPQPGYVAYEELADLVDEKLDPLTRREVMEKVTASPRVRAEFEDLARFKREVAAPSRRENPTRSFLRTWSLPLAAAFAAGTAFLWWSVIAPQHAGALALRDNGMTLRITPDGSVRGGPELPPDLRASLKSALSQNRLDVPPVIASLRGETGNLAGTELQESGLRAVAPIGTAVEEAMPEFHWTSAADATGYRVTIARQADAQPIASADVSKDQLSWRAPRPLARGEKYLWQVQALQGENVIATAPAPPQPEAQFEILSDADEQALASLRERVGRSHLGLALAYAHAGVLDKADAELAALQNENGQSSLPEKLRAALRNGAASR